MILPLQTAMKDSHDRQLQILQFRYDNIGQILRTDSGLINDSPDSEVYQRPD